MNASRRTQRKGTWIVALMCVGLASIVLIACSRTSTPAPQSNSLAHPPDASPRTPAASAAPLSSWKELLSSAQAEARQIDSEVALQWVTSSFTYDQIVNDKPAQINFIFVRSTGTRIYITLEDSAPPHLVGVQPAWDNLNATFSREQLEAYKSLLSVVNLGPRDIAQAVPTTDMDPEGFVLPGLFLDENYENTLGTHVAWGVVFSSSITHSAVTLFVSPQTGEILTGNGGAFSGTPVLTMPTQN